MSVLTRGIAETALKKIIVKSNAAETATGIL